MRYNSRPLETQMASNTLRLNADDFGIEYVEKVHAEHLLTALSKNYTVTTDWTGAKFTGIDITWDYTARTC